MEPTILGDLVIDESGMTIGMRMLLKGVDCAGSGDMAGARQMYEKAAAMGEPKALVNLGGLEFALNNLKAAADLWERAAFDGEISAFHNLGLVYGRLGRDAEARSAHERAANAGHPDSMYCMAGFAHGSGDTSEELRWVEKAALAGRSTAMVLAGTLRGKRGEYESAVEWYEKAIQLGHIDAEYDLAMLFGRMGRREEQKRRLLDLALCDDDDAMSSLGTLCLEDNQTESAIRWLTKAAGMNNAAALNNIGVWFRDRDEHDRARAAFERAAKIGDSNAAASLSNYAIDEGDAREALFWLRPYWEKDDELATRNVSWILDRQEEWAEHDVAALNDLGVLYMDLGLLGSAEESFQSAADLGHTAAMRNLATLLKGLDRGAEARNWLESAAAAGNEEARCDLDALGEGDQPPSSQRPTDG